MGQQIMLDTSTLSTTELKDLRAKMDQEIADRARTEMQGAMDSIKELMTAHSIPVQDLISFLQPKSSTKTRTRSSGTKNPVKYRNPATGETWTGRGRKPNWIKAHPNLEQFLVGSPQLKMAS